MKLVHFVSPVIVVNGDGECTEVQFMGMTFWKVSKPTAPFLRKALEAERKQATRYKNALQGIASCATVCDCCEMHKRVAQGVIDGKDP